MAQLVHAGSLYEDPQTGQLYREDPDGDADVGRFRPFAALRKPGVREALREGDLAVAQARLSRREQALNARFGAAAASVSAQTGADSLASAKVAGLVTQNQYDGLGFVSMTASGGATPTGTLSDQINRTLWIRGIVLDSDSPGFVIVTAASVAGIPINVGSKGAPIRMWSHDSTRVSFEFAPRMAMVGQTVSVSVQNIDAAAGHSASGGLVADEINPFAFQRTMEAMLLAGLGVQAEV